MKQIQPKWAVVIQARTGSTRLPGKMLRSFYQNKTLIEVVLDTMIGVFQKEQLILATTRNAKDDDLEQVATRYGIACYRGDEEDVLQRFVNVVQQYDLEYVLRICADNPFFIPSNLKELMDIGLQHPMDYVAYFFSDKLPTIRSHSGFFGEWVSAKALIRAASMTSDPFYHEHVTNFIYGNEDQFSIFKIPIPHEEFCRKVRLTIDTEEDFQMAQSIFMQVKENSDAPVTIAALQNYINAQPEYLQRMQRIIQNYQK